MSAPPAARAAGTPSATRTVALRLPGFSARVRPRAVLVCGILASVVVVLFLVSLATGDYRLTLGQVTSALTGHADGLVRTIVLDWRLPRATLALLFGAALGLGGAVFQSLTRNPLGSPDIIGFDTGAYTGALVVMLWWHGGIGQQTAAAVVGGLATACAVYLLAYRRGVQGFRLVIVGIGVSAMLGAFNTWLILTSRLQDAMGAAAFGAGSLNEVGYGQLGAASAVLAVLVPAVLALGRRMRLLEMGDDAARQLGVPAEPTRLLLVAVGVGLTATVTAIAGPIAFVALVAPQVARRLVASPGTTLVGSALTGAVLLQSADWTAQHLVPTTPLPVGVVTVVLGGSYFVWLLVKEGLRS
ncbi:iron-enterobactin ABC transporter permease [Luteimicrobium xylanilyticum]|uniref:Iron(3+)-hydroxamate import system permease protein FhuG n=1 Tax=Luteimicrobium xylanilyticum TaxID=1133546 RepID=A0A5P9Q6X8_9MICO|nr:iron chelate uptake ABC transporter family permease subunit [Luteimicrobium xylanilyticum]QFU96860.1 Iron(3+)-hydroxamate import system permease protein FhuG [Luteimicrobium xylanilyticum]